MSLLLALTAAVAPPPAPPPAQSQATPGWWTWSPPEDRARRLRERWRQELDALTAKVDEPEEAVQPEVKAPQRQKVSTVDVGAYVEALLKDIARARRVVELAQAQAEFVRAEQERAEAQARLELALQIEAQARREMRDFDVAFIAAMLAAD